MNPAQGKSDLQQFVTEYYGKQLASSEDLLTNACCASGAPPVWIAEKLINVNEEVSNRFYGCGFPIPHGLAGATVADLGCGTGRDAYVIAQLVGESGHVHGVDMTDEQLEVARNTSEWHAEKFGYSTPNTTFHKGYIEDLKSIGLENDSLDVIVSNCVVNLSPRKDLVLAEVWRALKVGGEFYVSDVFVDRRLPEDVATDPVLYAECLGGALYQNDFVAMAKDVGFRDPRVVSTSPIELSKTIAQKVGSAKFVSVTYRLFKLPELDPQCEDYGQSATYLGGIEGAESLFWLDDKHAFEIKRPERVCRNTAQMLASTRFAKHFRVDGDTETHFGEFPCNPTTAASDNASAVAATGGSCC